MRCLSRPVLSVNNQPISTLKLKGAKVTKFDQLMQLISNVSKEPLKPQQRLDILKTNIIPQLIHQLVLAPSCALPLKNLDIQIRKAVNRWLCLPNASPLGYFYAPVGAGGLGLPRLRTNIPVLKSNRWENLLLFDHPVINSFKVDLAYVNKIEDGINYLKDDNLVLNSKHMINKIHTDSLYNSCDGENLKFHSELPFVHSWL